MSIDQLSVLFLTATAESLIVCLCMIVAWGRWWALFMDQFGGCARQVRLVLTPKAEVVLAISRGVAQLIRRRQFPRDIIRMRPGDWVNRQTSVVDPGLGLSI